MPDNDKIADAQTITCGETVNGSTQGASLNAPGAESCAGISPEAPNVWYVYEGTGEWVTASLCGTNWDTRLSVYLREGDELLCVGANDDYDCDGDGNWFGERNAQFQFWGQNGKTYYLMVQEKPDAGGLFQLEVDCAPLACDLPLNQSCSFSQANVGTALQLEANAACSLTRGDNSCASWATSFGECVFPGYAFQDIWYRFDTDDEPMVNLTLTSRGIRNSVVNIYDDCTGEELQCFIGDVDEELDWLAANTSYLIQVLSLTDRSGPFDICLYTCTTATIYYPDLDGDGYGNENASVELCTTEIPPNMILQGGDCLDFHVNAHEDMDEICDGWDNDCDGEIDNFCKDEVPAMLRVDASAEAGNCSGTLFAQSTGSGEWVYLLGPYGGAIAAFRDVEEMGSVEYSYRLDLDPGRYWELDDEGLPDEVVSPRDININVQFPPQGEIPLRLFHLTDEVHAFLQATQQAFLMESPPLLANLSLTKVPAQGCPDGSLPDKPELVPILSWGESINGHYFETSVSGFSRFYLHANKFGNVLPVEFGRIQLRESGSANELVWWVSGEEALSHYQIERSVDNRNFSLLGRQEASGQARYQFTDRGPLPAAYYRIKAVDLDGQVNYSPLQFLRREALPATWNIYPNPASGNATVMSSHARRVLLRDALGNVRRGIKLSVGTNRLDLSGLPGGIYFLSMMDGGDTRGETLILSVVP